MRTPMGYSGPVAHWWYNCLTYTGVGLDWRYEGIILGYLNLYEQTGDQRWLVKARRAGDDLVRGQLPTGNYRNSSFELNPYTGGTPHEAAADIALLSLAKVLMQEQGSSYDQYLDVAKRNLEGYYARYLSHPDQGIIYDHVTHSAFVPNKAATGAEAFLLLSQVTGDENWAEKYALSSIDFVLKHQVSGGSFDGAIHQLSVRGQPDGRFFPYYIARCASGLFELYRWSGRQAHLNGALRAADFVCRHMRVDGSFPQVIYANGRVGEYPKWVAATGDILRVVRLARQHGFSWDEAPTWAWLRNGQDQSGAFRSALGFGVQVSQRQSALKPEFRDILAVVGWVDKAFRYLTERMSPSEAALSSQLDTNQLDDAVTDVACMFRGTWSRYWEDKQVVKLERGNTVLYEWTKGDKWARMIKPELLGV